MSDSLPARLVHQAAEAIRDANEEHVGVPDHLRPWDDAVEWEPEARAAVAATLRAISQAMLDDKALPMCYDPADFAILADEIERAGVSGQPASEERHG